MPKLKNIFWITGDRFLCVQRKNQIIDEITTGNKNNYEIKKIEDPENISQIGSAIFTTNVFGPSNKIIIIDGEPDNGVQFSSLLKKMNSNIYIILITESANKTTNLYKNLSQYLETYESVFVDNRINYSALKNYLPTLKKFVPHDISDDLLKKLFELCDYNYGKTYQEIEKIITYCGHEIKDYDASMEQVLCERERILLDELLKSLNSKNIKQALSIIGDMSELSYLDNGNMLLMYSIIDNYYFLLFCKMAHEYNLQDTQEVGEFIAQYYSKSGNKSNPISCGRRFFFFKDFLTRYTIDQISKNICFCKNALQETILGDFNQLSIFNRLVFNLTKN